MILCVSEGSHGAHTVMCHASHDVYDASGSYVMRHVFVSRERATVGGVRCVVVATGVVLRPAWVGRRKHGWGGDGRRLKHPG